MNNYKVLELTKDNYSRYLNQIVGLEEAVLKKMETEGQKGQFFTTGYDDVLEYILSKENTVLVAVNEKDKVLAATYITEGQTPYTYNDITKYFKTGEKYQEWVKSQYSSEAEYKNDVLDAYKLKMEAYNYAKSRILKENPQYTQMLDYLNHELNEYGNAFHEKSKLRECINKYMSEYVNKAGAEQLYERFYWTTADDISKLFEKDVSCSEDMKEYEEILSNMKLESIEEPEIDYISQYYTANTSNSVEIDTYITDPNVRDSGIAKVLVYEGIKKYIERHFENPDEKEMFLCSTLHRLNVSSKYVSEFFGLKDSLYVNRRFGRTREVHIKRIEREETQEYLDNMYDKLAVLNDYNPENREISKETMISILREEIDSRKSEAKRLKTLKLNSNFKGRYRLYLHNRIMGIIKKSIELKEKINKYSKLDGDSIEL